jgi:ABC-type nitrate/sulfonate/bicarbonate transport system substrate-binding protein
MSARFRAAIVVLFVATVMLLVVAGCGGSTATSAQKVTVMLDWTPNTNHTGVYLAKQQGTYAKAGLDVEIVEPGQSEGLAQVAAGNAQFAFSYAEQVLPVRAQGTPVVSIATVLRTNTSSLMSPADRHITRPRDLAGKTYGTFGGPIEEPLIKALVACDGGDPDSVMFVDVGNADYSVGFRKKAYDAVWVFDGWDVIRLRDIARTPITTIAFRDHLDCIPDWYTPVIVTSEKILREQPDLVRTFLTATAEGYRTAITAPRVAADALMAGAPESDRSLVEASARFLAPFFATTPATWGYQDPAVWEGFDAFLRKAKIVTAISPVADAFTNDFLPAQ